ncbi:MAG: hypothetical protein O9327_02480 [Polaromonas sp.]|nr:hypothetical protein [Polaromonas sp.]
MTPQNLNPGVFEIVDADGDIVHLGWDSECHAAGRRGWVNVGAHAVLIALDDNGDLYVEAYPLDNELNPTATLSVKKEAAMKAGALDGDAG